MDRLSVPWVEHHDTVAPRSYRFTSNQSSVTMVVDVDAGDLSRAIGEILGYPKHTGPGQLSRRTPARCPYFPHMTAVAIDNVVGQVPWKYQQTDLGVVRNKTVKGIRYRRERMTILFEPQTYNILEDAEIYGVAGRTEFDRYVTKGHVEPAIKFLTAHGGDTLGTLKWAEGPGATGFAPDSPKRVISFNVGQPVPEYNVQWTWHQVPESALFTFQSVLGHGGGRGGGYQRTPVNIQGCLGGVNDDFFGGYAAGTLLLVGVKLLPEISPVQPVLMGLDPLSPGLVYRVEYYVLHQPLGCNKFPYRGSAPVQWFLATTDGLTDGPTLYQKVDFNLLFTPV